MKNRVHQSSQWQYPVTQSTSDITPESVFLLTWRKEGERETGDVFWFRNVRDAVPFIREEIAWAARITLFEDDMSEADSETLEGLMLNTMEDGEREGLLAETLKKLLDELQLLARVSDVAASDGLAEMIEKINRTFGEYSTFGTARELKGVCGIRQLWALMAEDMGKFEACRKVLSMVQRAWNEREGGDGNASL